VRRQRRFIGTYDNIACFVSIYDNTTDFVSVYGITTAFVWFDDNTTGCGHEFHGCCALARTGDIRADAD
jgi:hypothetical protein